MEAKRGQFPRFYFLSNEDLLEIIGQSKDPKPIVQHISKMFEGVNSLEFNEQTATKGQKTYEVSFLVSVEKEKIELKPFPVDAKAEQWLKQLITQMKDALRKLFHKYYNEHL